MSNKRKESVIDLSGQFLWRKVLLARLESEIDRDVVSMDLSTCHVCGKCAEKIIELMHMKDANLRVLNLKMCRMDVKTSAAIVRAIPDSKVKELILDGNVLTVDVCKVIGEVLAKNPSLEKLSVKRCDIPADGCIVLAMGLPKASNLRVLLLDENCIFDRGAQALAGYVPSSALVALSVADNQIWSAGTSVLLRANIGNTKLVSLNLAYNIVDIVLVVQFLKQVSSVKEVSITGCKVNEANLEFFFEEVRKTRLEMLAIESLNYSVLPVSWPKVADTIWSNQTFFTSFLRVLQTSETLSTVRLGFMELTQIHAIAEMYKRNEITRPLLLGFSDFGRTSDRWVISFPEFSIMAPTSLFKWAAENIGAGSLLFAEFFKASKYESEEEDVSESQPLTSISLSGIKMNDTEVTNIFSSLIEADITEFDEIDLSRNPFGDAAIENIITLFKKANIGTFDISQTSVTEVGVDQFLKSFTGKASKNAPSVFKFSLKTTNDGDTEFHELFNALASMIKSDSPLEELVIEGPVTAVDLTSIFEMLPKNTHLRSLVVSCQIPEKYKGESPQIDEEVQATYDRMVFALHEALTSDGSKCVLSEFVFPLLTSVFLFSDEILNIWHDVESGLAANR